MTETTLETNLACPCCSGQAYDDCCGPLLSGAPAPTAEALMRSRYTAFARGAIDYLRDTMTGRQRHDFDRAAAEAWSRKSEWLGLEILSVDGGTETDSRGTVEFIARFKADGVEQQHHERASFRREAGRWRYDDGVDPNRPAPVVAAPKPGRNDPCSCGSGKKYKRCCGAG